jgi:histidinol-phosphate/aromatic aminotransferase/cobyric acid decarboxylase-like protein
VNPFYPPRRLTDEIKANFEKLSAAYPSGQRVQSLLAAKDFDLFPEQVVVGNGASELIAGLLRNEKGRIGLIRPSFEEYLHRCMEETVVFEAKTPGFRYSAKDLTGFFEDKEIRTLVLVNPDNPSGNYLSKMETEELLLWTEKEKIRLILDESFTDFSEEGTTFLDKHFLEKHPTMIVVKSISKSYGIPGLRLGILASGDRERIAALKQEIPIWNINSFAEFYLQIMEKYAEDYQRGLSLLRAERKRFAKALAEVDGITVYPSEANYLMIELTNGAKAAELTARLFSEDKLLVKDLSEKTGGEYLRLAIRTPEENDLLVNALRKVL